MPFDDDQYHRLLSAAGLSKSWTRTMQKRRLSGKMKIFPPVVGRVTARSVGLIRRYQRRIRHPAQMPDAA
ncbi:3-alpha domain-containing protein [Escherichia coli]